MLTYFIAFAPHNDFIRLDMRYLRYATLNSTVTILRRMPDIAIMHDT